MSQLVMSDNQFEEVDKLLPPQLIIHSPLHGYLVHKWCTRITSLQLKPWQGTFYFCHNVDLPTPPQFFSILIAFFISYICFWRYCTNHKYHCGRKGTVGRRYLISFMFNTSICPSKILKIKMERHTMGSREFI